MVASVTKAPAASQATMDRHVLSVLVENHYGVLSRVAGMFAARGFNIDSLTVCETEDPSMSRMTLSLTGETIVIDQIRKQLDKLAEVVAIEDFTERGPYVERELALLKFRPYGARRPRQSFAGGGAVRCEECRRDARHGDFRVCRSRRADHALRHDGNEGRDLGRDRSERDRSVDQRTVGSAGAVFKEVTGDVN